MLLSILSLLGCTKEKNMNVGEYTAFFDSPAEKKLIAAVFEDKRDAVAKLISEGVNPNMVGKYEYTPLRAAIKAEHSEMLKLLLEQGADANFITSGASTAGYWAAMNEDPVYLKLLLDAGMDPNIKNGKTPIIFETISGSRWKHYDMLVAHGADHLHTKAGDDSTVALYLAMQSEDERLKQLILQGADVETPTKGGLTVVEVLSDFQKRFSGNPKHPAYIARVELLEMLREKGLEIPDGLPGVSYPEE